jgi:GNAT superfamily N-acetyltransferase
MELTHRTATRADLPSLEPMVDRAIDELQRGYLDAAQIAASHAIMGLDTQLVDDGTYYVVEGDGAIAGCGGWSRRGTLFGGDHSAGRDTHLLDPAVDAARVRAMYTHPDFTRRGVGRLILTLCEQAAAAEGFTRIQLHATMAGLPLYRAYGFEPVEEVMIESDGVPIPAVHMTKDISPRSYLGG